VSNQDDRPRPPETAARIKRSAAEQRESERVRAFEAVEATFPAPTAATADELVQMAIHALGFDAASLAASLGIARSAGEALMRNPGTVSSRHRALLAQYLEMRQDTGTAQRNRVIAAKLRERIATEARGEAEGPVRPNPGA
jgi:kynurenine formamidase